MGRTKRTDADRLRTMTDTGRLRAEAIHDIFEDWAEPVREWADGLAKVADEIDTARDEVEGWEYAEGRDERADAKENALAAIDSVLGAIWALDGLPDLPAGLCESPALFQIVRTPEGERRRQEEEEGY